MIRRAHRRLTAQRQTVILRYGWGSVVYADRLVIYSAMPEGRRCPCHTCRDRFYGLQPMIVEVEA